MFSKRRLRRQAFQEVTQVARAQECHRGREDGPVRFVALPGWPVFPAKHQGPIDSMDGVGSIWGPKRAISRVDSGSLGVQGQLNHRDLWSGRWESKSSPLGFSRTYEVGLVLIWKDLVASGTLTTAFGPRHRHPVAVRSRIRHIP